MASEDATIQECGAVEYEEMPAEEMELNSLDLVNRLDNDSLTKIFMYLPFKDRIRCERVCKRWQSVCSEAWYDVKKLNILSNFRQWYPGVNWSEPKHLKFIEQILKRSGRYLTNVELISWAWPDDYKNIFEVMQASCTRHTLNLKLVIKSKDHLSHLKLPANLNKLNIHVGFGSNTSVELEPSAFKELKNLEFLSLNGFSISSEFLDVICENSNLTEFNVTNCSFPDESIQRLCCLPSIEKLNFWSIDSITNNLLANLALKCTNLKKILITGDCPNLTESGISKLISTAPNLVDLTIGYCDHLIKDLLTIINSYENRLAKNFLPKNPPKQEQAGRSPQESSQCLLRLYWKKNQMRRAKLPFWVFLKSCKGTDISKQIKFAL